MSKNCINCIKNERTNSDMLCDECRELETHKHGCPARDGKPVCLCATPRKFTAESRPVNNRMLHEHAAGMNLEDSFFSLNGIDPKEIVSKNGQLVGSRCKACDCKIDEDGCGCNPHDA